MISGHPSAYIIMSNGVPQYYVHSRKRAEKLTQGEGMDFLSVLPEENYNEHKTTKGSAPLRK